MKLLLSSWKRKYNADTTRKGFPIEMYMGDLPHEPYFITLTLQGQLIMGPIKKIVALYMVGDLALLD